MQFSRLLVFVVLLLVLSMTLVYSTEEAGKVGKVGKIGKVGKVGKVGKACLPSSCQSYGCCSGNCDYWCRQCGIDFVC